ncbi:MAG: hypothetical protein ACR2GA_03755 [Chloroflexota bacterium]
MKDATTNEAPAITWVPCVAICPGGEVRLGQSEGWLEQSPASTSAG